MAFATYAKSYKSGGINLNGIPVNAAGAPILAATTDQAGRCQRL